MVEFQTYLPSLDGLVIWNNTPGGDLPDDIKREALAMDKIRVLGNGRNEGLGKALNEAARFALANNFTHLLTMDQDSSFPEGVFKIYRDRVENKPDPDIFAYCVNAGGGK